MKYNIKYAGVLGKCGRSLMTDHGEYMDKLLKDSFWSSKKGLGEYTDKSAVQEGRK